MESIKEYRGWAHCGDDTQLDITSMEDVTHAMYLKR